MPYSFKGQRNCTKSDGTKGHFLTVKKKDGTRRCYDSEAAYKRSKAASYANEEDQIKGESIMEIRKGIRALILECCTDMEVYDMEEDIVNPVMNMITSFSSEPAGRMFDYGSVKSDGHEGSYIKQKLHTMGRQAQSLHDRLQDQDDLPQWVHNNIATAQDRLSQAYQYMDYEISQAKKNGTSITESFMNRLARKVIVEFKLPRKNNRLLNESFFNDQEFKNIRNGTFMEFYNGMNDEFKSDFNDVLRNGSLYGELVDEITSLDLLNKELASYDGHWADALLEILSKSHDAVSVDWQFVDWIWSNEVAFERKGAQACVYLALILCLVPDISEINLGFDSRLEDEEKAEQLKSSARTVVAKYNLALGAAVAFEDLVDGGASRSSYDRSAQERKWWGRN